MISQFVTFFLKKVLQSLLHVNFEDLIKREILTKLLKFKMRRVIIFIL